MNEEHVEQRDVAQSVLPQVNADSLAAEIAASQDSQTHPSALEFPAFEDLDDEIEDDDDILSGLNQDLPAAAYRPSAMDINHNQDELTVFCMDNDISMHVDLFKQAGFDSVHILVKMNKSDSEGLGMNLGQAMKCEDVFIKHRKGVKAVQNEQSCGGNIHHQRRKKRNMRNHNDEDVLANDDDEQKTNERFRIRSLVQITVELKRKFRDKVINIILVQSQSTDIKQIRVMIGNNTKNGDISAVRYFYDEANDKYPNTPILAGYAGVTRLKYVGLVFVENEYFSERGRSGLGCWKGTLTRIKLSSAWNNGTPSQREELYNYVRDHSGVDWIKYARNQADQLNCTALGLIGAYQPQYNKTLEEVIASNNE